MVRLEARISLWCRHPIKYVALGVELLIQCVYNMYINMWVNTKYVKLCIILCII